MNDDFHRELVAGLLEDSLDRPGSHVLWSTQGFGMARIYLTEDRDVRLNIWHSALAVDGLTPETGMVHTHPWDFTSRIVVGQLRNQRYRWQRSGPDVIRDGWCRAEITPGPGGHFDAAGPSGHDSRRFGNLVKLPLENNGCSYGPGGTYSQTHDEIHHTEYVDGTVTINRRERGSLPDRAFTFWKSDREWVSAEPKPADGGDLVLALEAALELLS
jgi:hypothetical protein